MTDLKPALAEMRDKILKADPRFEVTDAEHVIDTQLGIEYHLYDPKLNPGKPYKITPTDSSEPLLKGTQLTGAEADILDEIRVQLYKFFTEQAREHLNKLYTKTHAAAPSKINVKPKQQKM